MSELPKFHELETKAGTIIGAIARVWARQEAKEWPDGYQQYHGDIAHYLEKGYLMGYLKGLEDCGGK